MLIRRVCGLRDPGEVSECCNWFYAAALMDAKLLVRGQLWQAKFREWDLLRQLLRMVEWDHRARYGWDYDTWYNGKNIDRWADADVLSAAHACWSALEHADMQRVLRASVVLFSTLELRTANRSALTRSATKPSQPNSNGCSHSTGRSNTPGGIGMSEAVEVVKGSFRGSLLLMRWSPVA